MVTCMRWSGRTKRKDHGKEGLRAEGGTYCACVAGPLHRVHATDSQGRQASPESRRQVFCLFACLFVCLTVWLLPSSVPF